VKTLICIAGPTASGKTALALALAERLGTEILSADARQIYRGMDIGTAKASLAERARVPHHFIDILDPDQPYSAGQFQRDADALLADLFRRHDAVVAAGGSTLYLDALWHELDDLPPAPPEIRERLKARLAAEGLPALAAELERADPETWEAIDRQNPARVLRALEVQEAAGRPISALRQGRRPRQTPWRCLKLALHDTREALYARIGRRVEEMLAAGLEEEARGLLARGYSPDLQSLQTIGYREMIQYLHGEISREEAIRLIQRNTRRYAKRQMTWLRRYPDLHWCDAQTPAEALGWVLEQLGLEA
jgi:tRNA dimethylallyltransferase